MITRERYGIRADGRPITEVTTFIPIEPDHPLAVEVPGEEGTWVRVSIGNSLTAMGAREVSYQEFTEAVQESELLHEAVLQDIADRQERLEQQAAERTQQARDQLAELGISPEVIDTILARGA